MSRISLKPETYVGESPHDSIPTEADITINNALITKLQATLFEGGITRREYENFILRILKVKIDTDGQFIYIMRYPQLTLWQYCKMD